MELHHKLRRDPNWHPSACNICGQLGHQAVNCTNGTINWKQIYGEESFRLTEPIYPSQYDALKKAKQVDYTDLAKRAVEYAKSKNGAAGVDYDAMAERAKASSTASPQVKTEGQSSEKAADSAATPAQSAPAAEKAPEDALPPDWATAKDSNGRTYYWHTKSKKVQWDRPTS
ncbi:hypothetical protein WJX73_007644 [Symbiochloris irregularis]|uniref:WW domain-containing protein n=1 Tax=Symbiochloris irregularis TaxID=706552 RepID=A0AAW1P0K4_9CHLO